MSWISDLLFDVFCTDVDDNIKQIMENPGMFSKNDVMRAFYDSGVKDENQLKSLGERYGKG